MADKARALGASSMVKRPGSVTKTTLLPIDEILAMIRSRSGAKVRSFKLILTLGRKI